MTYEQYLELYAMNLFSQEEARTMLTSNTRRVWHELPKKERNRFRGIADKMLEEAGIEP